MIYVMDDTHVPYDVKKPNAKNFPEQKQMSKDDFLLICGDFGCIWDGGKEEKYWLKWFCERNYTTLFVDGNHENFTMLNEFEITEFHGGEARIIADSVYHLMRGEVYEIEGKRSL